MVRLSLAEEDLNAYLYQIEEAKKRDHRKLGKELDLFMFSEYGPGFPFWMANGMVVYHHLENYLFELLHQHDMISSKRQRCSHENYGKSVVTGKTIKIICILSKSMITIICGSNR